MYDTVIQTRCWSTDGRPGVKNWYFKNARDALVGKRRLELCGFEIVNELKLIQKVFFTKYSVFQSTVYQIL